MAIINILRSIKRAIYPDSYYSKIEARASYRWYNKVNAKQQDFKFVNSKRHLGQTQDYCRQFESITDCLCIQLGDEYIYPYDPEIVRLFWTDKTNIASVTVDYGEILNSSLLNIQEYLQTNENERFVKVELSIIRSLRKLATNIAHLLDKEENERAQVLKKYFERFLDNKPDNFDEALQKILFYNACFWQMRHKHNGLGRLGYILEEYYQKDFASGRITRDIAKKKVKNFLQILNKDMHAKSLGLPGDTGQYILISGITKNGINFDSEVDELFLESIQELNIPDPKLVLRANDQTNERIWDRSISCLLRGTGSPLIMNETIIIEGMNAFGYSKDDTYNVGISACWEPLIIGKSFDQNNALRNISLIESLNNIIQRNAQRISFEQLKNEFIKEVELDIKSSIRDIGFDCSPLYSLFFDDCLCRALDFSQGGAKYSYYGVEVVGLPNVINSLLNIKKFVYDDGLYSLAQINEAIQLNFEGLDDLRLACMNNPLRFGCSNSEVLELTQYVMSSVAGIVSKLTVNNCKLKVGFSSSAYLSEKYIRRASFDGRKEGEPLATHISPTSHKVDIKEIIDFSSKLDYSGNIINGNVVDFIIPSGYADNPDKLKLILKNAIRKGVFELQLNVLDADTLKDAKLHPEKYPDLIVRVWGFSAYFNDLPEEYKDNLIRRAEFYN